MNIYGAGGHAKVVIDCCTANKLDVENIFDDNLAIHSFMGYQVNHEYDRKTDLKTPLIIAVGNNKIREEIADKVGHAFGRVFHPSCLISGSAGMGKGTVVFHGSIVQSDVSVGQHVIVNTGASVDHDCKIGDFAHIGPGSVVCGGVEIGRGTMVGAGAVIIPGIRIGQWATIGAGSVVVSDVPDHAVVVGNPGKIIKLSHDR